MLRRLTFKQIETFYWTATLGSYTAAAARLHTTQPAVSNRIREFMQIADAPLMGLPANTPPRPANPGEYLPVHDVPPPREETVLDRSQQEKLEKELLAARDRQTAGTKASQRRSN